MDYSNLFFYLVAGIVAAYILVCLVVIAVHYLIELGYKVTDMVSK